MKKLIFVAVALVTACLLTVGAGFVMILGIAGGMGSGANAPSCDNFYAEPGADDVPVNRQALTELMDFYVNPAHYAPGNPYGHTSRDDVVQERVWVIESAVGVGHNRPGGSPRTMLINLMTGRQESAFQNLVQADSDRDSNGYLQQRPSMGWGTIAQLRNPVYATNAFYDVLMNIEDRDRMELTEVAQAVQRSAFPDAYAQWEQLGRDILEQGFGIIVDDSNSFQTSEEFAAACAEAVHADPSVVTGSADGMSAELERQGYENGKLPDSILVEATPGCMIANINGAPEAWAQLMQRADEQGIAITAGGCNRPFAVQVSVRNNNCTGPRSNGIWDDPPCSPPTATPGHSNHGYAVAIDIFNSRTQEYVHCGDSELVWLEQNAPDFGWKHPDWAQCDQSTKEGWHWEYDGNPVQVDADPATQTRAIPASFGIETPGDTAVTNAEPTTLFITTEPTAVMAPVAIITSLFTGSSDPLNTFSPPTVDASFALTRNATQHPPGRQKEKYHIK